MNALRIVLAVVAALLIVALIGWARGTPHHRGEDVGSLGATPAVARIDTVILVT